MKQSKINFIANWSNSKKVFVALLMTCTLFGLGYISGQGLYQILH